MIAVLNLTTERAPTRPSDKAKELFTTAIMEDTLIVNNSNVFPNDAFDEKVFEYLLNKYLRIIPAMNEKTNVKRPLMNVIW